MALDEARLPASAILLRVPQPPTNASFECNQIFPEGWKNTLSPEVRAANRALARMHYQPMGLLDPDGDYSYKPGIRVMPEYDSFEFRRIGESGSTMNRGYSRNEVGFGSLELVSTDRHHGGRSFVIPVAIKRIRERVYQEQPELSSHPEFGLWEALRNTRALVRGFIHTTIPVAVICDKKDSFILTHTRKDIKSLDTEPWGQYRQGKLEVDRHFQRLLAQIAQTTADATIRGIQLGDAQLKNYYSTIIGEVGFLDWEEAQFYDFRPSSDQMLRAAYQDMHRLYLSLSGDLMGDPNGEVQPPRILGGDPQERIYNFTKLVIDPYIRRMEVNIKHSGHLSNQEIDSLFDHTKDPDGIPQPNLSDTIISAI